MEPITLADLPIVITKKFRFQALDRNFGGLTYRGLEIDEANRSDGDND